MRSLLHPASQLLQRNPPARCDSFSDSFHVPLRLFFYFPVMLTTVHLLFLWFKPILVLARLKRAG